MFPLKRTLFAAVLVVLLLLPGCAAPSAASAESSQPEPPPPSSTQPVPEEPPAVEPPASARLYSEDPATGAVAWELEVTDREELETLALLLSPRGLAPLTGEQDAWLTYDGRVSFELRYPDRTVIGLADPRRWSRIPLEENRGTLWLREEDASYPHPADRCDQLLDYLIQKGVLEPEPPAPGPDEQPAAIRFCQVTLGIDRVYTDWELVVTDREELAELTDILSPDGLTPISAGEAGKLLPDGGQGIGIQWEYAGVTLGGGVFAQKHYRCGPGGSAAYSIANARYLLPGERCDRLLKFLEEHNITVTG